MKNVFGTDMPGKPPFLESGLKIENEKMNALTIDRRITSKEFVILIAYMSAQQYYEVKDVCLKWLHESLSPKFSENVVKKAVKKLVDLGLLETE